MTLTHSPLTYCSVHEDNSHPSVPASSKVSLWVWPAENKQRCREKWCGMYIWLLSWLLSFSQVVLADLKSGRDWSDNQIWLFNSAPLLTNLITGQVPSPLGSQLPSLQQEGLGLWTISTVSSKTHIYNPSTSLFCTQNNTLQGEAHQGFYDMGTGPWLMRVGGGVLWDGWVSSGL